MSTSQSVPVSPPRSMVSDLDMMNRKVHSITSQKVFLLPSPRVSNNACSRSPSSFFCFSIIVCFTAALICFFFVFDPMSSLNDDMSSFVVTTSSTNSSWNPVESIPIRPSDGMQSTCSIDSSHSLHLSASSVSPFRSSKFASALPTSIFPTGCSRKNLCNGVSESLSIP